MLDSVSTFVVDLPTCRFAAFLDNADLFDAAHFRLSRAEAISIDPQTRLLLQVRNFFCCVAY